MICFDPARLARFGAAHLNYRAQVRLVAEIVIEADHAVDFGAAEVEALGDQRLALGVDAAKLRLHIVQDRQQRPFAPVVLGDDFADLVLLGTHAFSLSACQAM